MLVARTGAVSLPDNKRTDNTNREKDEEMDDGIISGFKTSESWVSCEKLKKTRILSAPEGGHSRVWEQSWRKHWGRTSFWYGFRPHLEYEGETEKTIKEIVVVHREESALEDIVVLCHWSSWMPVKESCGQYDPSREASGGFSSQAWCVLSYLSVSRSLLLCSEQFEDGAVLTRQPPKQLLQ